MKMLRFLNSIAMLTNGRSSYDMAILTGNVALKFGDKYCLGSKNSEEDPDQLFFNDANSLELPPDDDYVKLTKYTFPGTIISIRFRIDPAVHRNLDGQSDD